MSRMEGLRCQKALRKVKWVNRTTKARLSMTTGSWQQARDNSHVPYLLVGAHLALHHTHPQPQAFGHCAELSRLHWMVVSWRIPLVFSGNRNLDTYLSVDSSRYRPRCGCLYTHFSNILWNLLRISVSKLLSFTPEFFVLAHPGAKIADYITSLRNNRYPCCSPRNNLPNFTDNV